MPRTESAKKAPAKKAAAKKPARTSTDTELSSDNWFAPLDDIIETTNTLLYGREGSGKSTAAARLANAATLAGLPPGKGKVLIINAEGGLKMRALKKRGVDTERIVVWPDPKNHERASHAGLMKIYRKIKADLETDPESWFGVGMDSATEVYQAILDYAQNKRVQSVKNRGVDVDEEHVDISDYGTMTKLFRDAMRAFRDLPCHFVVTALERRTVDKDTGKPTYGPDVTPGLQSDLLGYVDFVLMCKAEDEDGPFRALTRANSRYRAKDRFDILPKVMVDPYLDRIIDYVNDKFNVDEDNDPEQARLPARGKTAQDKPVKKDDDEEETEENEED